MTIELRLIRHALAVGRYGNFARAAEALHLTQPSLSRSIASLESALGVTLFDRTTKGVTPTASGRVLLKRGQEVLDREAALCREIGQLEGLESGTLVIAAGPYPAETQVAEAVARVARAHPRLRIECRALEPLQVVSDVLTERADVGISTVDGLEHEPRLVVEPLPQRRAYIACRPGHPLTLEPALTLERVLQFPLVSTVLRGAQAAASHQGSGAEGDYVPHVLVNSVAVAKVIARGSDLLVPGSAATLADEVAAGRLVILDVDAPAMRTRYGLYYLRERALAPAARVFVDTLHRVEAETPVEWAAPPAVDRACGAPRKRQPSS